MMCKSVDAPLSQKIKNIEFYEMWKFWSELKNKIRMFGLIHYWRLKHLDKLITSGCINIL